jgi:hypothetical protein
MDVFEGGAAVATADRVHDKLDLEDLMGDVKRLPETQRTALMLREMGDLSYDQIAETMDTSIPSVKSLLVRARVSLAEAAESRRLSCDEVRLELGAVAEGLQKISSPARRHVSDCERCRSFKKELSTTNRKLTMLAPVGAFAAFKALVALKLFSGAGAAGSSAAGGSAAAGSGAAAGAGATAAGTAAAGGAAASAGSSAAVAGLGAVAAKVGTGLVAAALVTGGVAQVARHDVSTAKIDQKATIAKVAPAVADPTKSGGATAAVGAVTTTVEHNKVDPTGATGATDNVSTTAPAADKTENVSDVKTLKPVVEKDSTTVSLGGHGGTSTSSGSSSETPGLPTGGDSGEPSAPSAGTPAAPAPSPQTGLTGSPEGSTSSSGGSGGPTE